MSTLEILRCGLKCITPRLRYASLVANGRKLRMTIERLSSFAALRIWLLAFLLI